MDMCETITAVILAFALTSFFFLNVIHFCYFQPRNFFVHVVFTLNIDGVKHYITYFSKQKHSLKNNLIQYFT